MTDSLLRSLRDHMLDESQPLAGLLRKCLLLGAETGSSSLRDWARRELNGYKVGDQVPEYRTFDNVPMTMNSISGSTMVTGQVVDRLLMPEEVQKFVDKSFTFRNAVEELEQLAANSSVSFTSPGLVLAQSVWNSELDDWQNIVDLKFVFPGSAIAGVLGNIRTQLVDVIADLTSATPLESLPRKEKVDEAVDSHIGRVGDVYNTTVTGSDAPIAIGKRAEAKSQGLTVDDALRLLGEVSRTATSVADGLRTELETAIHDLTSALTEEGSDTGEIVKKAGKLRLISEKIGVEAVSAASSSAAAMITELALNGAFA